MNTEFTNKIKSFLDIGQTVSKETLLEYIYGEFPKLKKSSINVYLSQLKKEGVIKNPSRGFYSIKGKEGYQPNVDIKLKRLFNRVKKEFPFAELCVWNTKWLNEFMRHQPFKYYTVLEVEKEVAESVFHALNGEGKPVFLEPDAETFQLYISNSSEALIVKQLVSESPLKKANKVKTPTLEKLLVDMTIDTELYAAQQGELRFIYENAFDKYEVNKNKMKRYAYRRNREQEVEKLTDLTLAKK
ncbi:winged helix-turn-helix domain-containing protein [Flagellimonas meridianipacifica]|uniref:Uncharacterized protein n=1 Tax=Flagellimonas meridianipacifica TaxID=1080225 RepID=A0A2T0MIG1_9FLAO|nr:winged helix-turn-helix domain-containing protein [Allomuricauda pacifica]PRX57372.1 hypothetical protein CLV81_1376 [Allomuricauda pacifica]